RQGGAGRVVRRAEEHHVRPVLANLRDGVHSGQSEVDIAVAVDPAGTGTDREQRVHRVRRGEAQRRAPRTAERLEQLLLDLVGTVGRPQVRYAQRVPEVGCEVPAQRHGIAVGVAVQVAQFAAERLGQRVHDLVGYRGGV